MAAFVPFIGVIGKLLDKIIPDKAANDAAKAQLTEMVVSGELATIAGQLEIDKAEAQSSSVFVAGWRPAIGWICAVALGVDFIVRPFVMWLCSVRNVVCNFPTLDLAELMPLVLGMLGLAATHAYENIKTQ